MTSVVQLMHPSHGRVVGLVSGAEIRVITGARCTYDIARQASASATPLVELAVARATGPKLSYDEIYAGNEWMLLAPFDHPAEPARCMVTGTGLTHRASADNRSAMHAQTAVVTDSMRMYQWGVDGGRPAPGSVGTSPEWFYKGNGTILLGHDQPLDVPEFAGDGGEESEIAGVYFIDELGTPRRAGMAQGNEFSDHVFEKKNYLYLASSKLRQCSLGPELVLDPDFNDVSGEARIERGGAVIWRKTIHSGEANMCHSVENIEHHHFKFQLHRRPGDIHIHFFGASAFSFGEGVHLQDGDVMEVAWNGFGRPLRNRLRVYPGPEKLARVLPV